MKRKCIIKENSKKEVGITLVALVVTIVVLLILASVAAYSGMESLRSANLTLFTTQLKIMQTQVNQMYQKMESNQEITVNGTIYKGKGDKTLAIPQLGIQDIGESITDATISTQANKALDGAKIAEADKANFKYYDKTLLKNLGIEGVDQNILVNIEKRKVVSYEGFKMGTDIYYTLDDVPNKDSLYNVEYSEETVKPTFDIDIEKLPGEDRWKISIVNIQNNGNIDKWQLQYQKVNSGDSSFWNTTDNMDFIVKEKNTYNIKIVNGEVSSDVKILDLTSDIVVQNSETTVYLPTGATVTNNDLNTGFTIKDVNQNEWTWVVVPKSIYATATKDTDYTNIRNDMITYASDYREGMQGQNCNWTDEWYDGCGIVDSETYTNKYNTMLKSVYDYGGFYVGKYEVGIKEDTVRSFGVDYSADNPNSIEHSTTNQTPVNMKDKIPYNWVRCSQAESLAEQLKPSQDKQSGLMFGIQWDLIMRYLEVKGGKTVADLKLNSNSFGNYEDVSFDITHGKYSYDSGASWNEVSGTYTKQSGSFLRLSTGTTTRNQGLNIFDVAGNMWEWTLEKTSDTEKLCSLRGGSYGDAGTIAIAFRRPCEKTGSYSFMGFRATFY